MKNYLIVIDLDGTTLTSVKTIHQRTKDAIKKVSQLGHKVVISTGRPFYSSYLFYDELELDTLIVNRNGGHIHSPHSIDYHYSVTIEKKTMDLIITSEIMGYIDHFYLEDRNDLYIIKGNNQLIKDKAYKFDHLYEHDRFDHVTMFTIYVKNAHVKEVLTFLDKVNHIMPVAWKHNGEFPNTMIEVFPKRVDKAEAIKQLCDYYQIPIERTIAFGDELNDVEMIKCVHTGVAMKNANDRLKRHADVCLEYSNDDGGVGIFLESFFQL